MPRKKKVDYKALQRRSTSPRQRTVTYGNRALRRGDANKGPLRLAPRHQFQIMFTEEGVDDRGRTVQRTTGKVLCRFTQPRPWAIKARRRASDRIAAASRKANR